ncbi:unnamed protein product [Adineta steineri]|uniref:Uncharacterized protein n=1 Tax=Adineta steineri TaxID=433720 RepID=A0A815N8B5_9BILA|nr:unnamed protein product [Adineta steineri]CAF1420568.1 unnamed protein product [Adineta steineri]CAF1426132.1 unnamed protein product [Adineta steineri]
MATSATILGKPSNKSRLPITSLNNQHSSNKTSKPSGKSFLVLSTIILLCVVGLVSFLIFHFYGNRQNKDESFLQHNNSDESMNSEMNESEIDLSTEYNMPVKTQLKLSNIEPSRKGGRVFSQLDPDA